MRRVFQAIINVTILLVALVPISASPSIARTDPGNTGKRIDFAAAVIGLEQRSGDLAMDASYEFVDGHRMLKVKLLADKFVVDAFVDVTSGITTRAVTIGLVGRDFITPEENRIASFQRSGSSLGDFLQLSSFMGSRIVSARFLEIGKAGRFSIVSADEEILRSTLSVRESQPAD